MLLPSRSRLRFGEDISPQATPLRSPTDFSARILVIGGGVTGLVTSWVLLDRGYKVTILSKEWATFTDKQRITSQIAGALWEFPPGGCGLPAKSNYINSCRDWALESYEIYRSMAANPKLAGEFGLRKRMLAMFFPHIIDEDEKKYEKMRTIERNEELKGFRRSSNLVQERGINPKFVEGIEDAYEHEAPVVDTDRAMEFLMRLVQNKGAELVTETIRGDLWENEAKLLDTYQADAIVNATGLAARELAGDPKVYPVRGATLRVINDGSNFPRVTSAAVVSTKTDSSGHFKDIIFMVPRNDSILVLGSIVQESEWDLNLTLDSPVVQELHQRCIDFLPALKNARLDPTYPLAQGLRPFREGSLRLERELRPRTGGGGGAIPIPSRIVHCYGHGGSGWTLAFGCARECVQLVEEALINHPPVPMDSRVPRARL